MENNIKQAQKLIKEINKKKIGLEYKTCTFKGVKNLSRSDLDMSIFYAEQLIQNNGYGFSGLMDPRGNVKEVLSKYNIC